MIIWRKGTISRYSLLNGPLRLTVRLFDYLVCRFTRKTGSRLSISALENHFLDTRMAVVSSLAELQTAGYLYHEQLRRNDEILPNGAGISPLSEIMDVVCSGDHKYALEIAPGPEAHSKTQIALYLTDKTV